MDNKKVLITGVSGMDGSHMTDYLLENTNHDIFGMVRRTSAPTYKNLIEALKNPRFKLITGDLSDSQSIDKVVEKIKPNYFINLAAQSFVKSSWELPEQTMDINSTGVLRCLEAIARHCPNCRFYNAGSSEQFGDVQYSPQDEKHPHRARSPYGSSKISAHQLVKTYRESFNLYAIQGLLFNHESPRRGSEFVTKKITEGVSRIYYAIKNNKSFEPIELGNLDAKRDWSDARDFVIGIWKMLNQEIYSEEIKNCLEWYRGNSTYHPKSNWGQISKVDTYSKTETEFLSKNIKEYVLSSNENHSIREFVELAFKEANIEGCWMGNGLDEQFVIANYLLEEKPDLSPILVKVNVKYYRLADVELLLGNSNLARKELGWTPKYSFKDLVKEMVRSDIENYSK